MDDFNKRLHEHALAQSEKHGKRILPADSTKETTYTYVGGGIVGGLALYAAPHFHIHGEMFRLGCIVLGFVVGALLGSALFNRLFVVDESWQPPIFDQSHDEYRAEVGRWMGR